MEGGKTLRRYNASNIWAESVTWVSSVKMDTLMRMQTSFEIADARTGEREIKVERYVPKAAPSEPLPKLL